jgi:hypothetical protein
VAGGETVTDPLTNLAFKSEVEIVYVIEDLRIG